MNKLICCGSFQEMEKLHMSLIKHGRFDFSCFLCQDLQEVFDLCKSDTSIICCKNQMIDTLLDRLQADFSASLIFEQAVKLEKDDAKILLLPIEVEPKPFLDEFLEKGQVFCCTCFGKSLGFVKNKFEEFCEEEKFDYEIITKSQFLHTIYFSKPLDLQKLFEAFGEGVFADSDVSIEQMCKRFVEGKTVAVFDHACGGNISAKLLNAGIEPKVVKVEFGQEKLEEMQIDPFLIAEKGIVSREVAFSVAKQLTKSADFVIVTFSGLQSEQRSFVAVGDKENVHLFSSVFSGTNEQICENISQFALFRFLKFLQENQGLA